MLVDHLLNMLKALHGLRKICFTQDAECSNIKDLAKRTDSDRFLNERAYEHSRNPKYPLISNLLIPNSISMYNP